MSDAVFSICESRASIWAYHLSLDGGKSSLCGRTDMMSTQLPLRTWGMKSEHIPEKYCSKCAIELAASGEGENG